jgi:hypothetical protein
MYEVIAIIIACTNPGDCQPMIGARMKFGECLSTSQSQLADFYRQYPMFDPKLGRIMCAEPRRVDAILGRHQA